MNIEAAKQLIQISLPHLKHYRKDLLYHDMRFMQEKPHAKFLHFTRNSGTHIVELMESWDYPVKGVKIKYLFGEADREWIVKEVYTLSLWHSKEDRCQQVIYYDGCKMIPITIDKALGIASLYVENMEKFWAVEDRK